MASSTNEQTSECLNEENDTTKSTNSELTKEVSNEDVKTKRENVPKTKRVSFHFGTRRDQILNTIEKGEDITLATIQNIYDSKTEINLVRSNSTKTRINKSAYIKLHRHSFSPGGNSSVDKLKGRYENIAKQTDNKTKTNIASSAKVNSDNNFRSVQVPSKDVNGSVEKSKKTVEPSISDDQQALKGESSSVENSLLIDGCVTSNSEPTSSITFSNLNSSSSSKSAPTTPTEQKSVANTLSPSLETKPSQLPVESTTEHSQVQKLKTDTILSDSTLPVLDISNASSVTEPSTKLETAELLETTVPELNETEAEKAENPENLLTKTTTNIEKLQRNLTTKLSNDTIQRLRNKYSPASFGYPKITIKSPKSSKKVQFVEEKPSKIPIPSPRNVLKSKPEVKSVTVKLVSTSDALEQNKVKDENSNVLTKPKPPEPPVKPTVPKEEFKLTEEEISEEIESVEVEISYDNIEFAEPEDKHFIVCRSSSEDSIDKLESSLSDFVMEKKPKEKKRSSSFRKILTGGFFGRDRKKSDEEKKQKKKDNAVFADNAQNESQVFDRKSSHRHTVDNSYPRRENQRKFQSNAASGPIYYYSPQHQYQNTSDASLGNRYTEMKGNNVVGYSRQPQYSLEDYVPMDNGNPNRRDQPQTNYINVNRYIDTSSSSSNTLDSENRNCTYQNVLVAQAEMRQMRENLIVNPQDNRFDNRNSVEGFQEISPHIQEAYQNVELVKPKALIPINSERPLPNPYHNNQDQDSDTNKTLDRNLNTDISKPLPRKDNLYERSPNKHPSVVVEEIYGTVFDNITPRTRSFSPDRMQKSASPLSFSNNKIPSPKSLEASKLKLPPNREKVELQPRIRSPIPQAKISTDKIIATELLRNKRSSPVPPPEMNNYSSPRSGRSPRASPKHPDSYVITPEIPRSSPHEYFYLSSSPVPKNKPPLSPRDVSVADCLQAAEWQRKQRELDKSPALESPKQITTNVLVHANREGEEQHYVNRTSYQRPPTYQPPPQVYQHVQPSPPRSLNSSLNNVRPQTPIQQHQIQQQSSPKSPEKQHMRDNVEAFYWRELKRLKEKEEQDLQNYRQQQLHVYGYVEDPVFIRRSRSVSPSMQRGRRSLSLPREARPSPNGRVQPPLPAPIPEGRPVIPKKPIALPTESSYGQVRPPLQRNPNFIRNTFERSTIGPIGTGKNYENYHAALSTNRPSYAPIFKRGSLTANTNVQNEPQYQVAKKVSFSSTQSPTSWPTKNGFTKSPPTRRVEREPSMDDDVFLPNSPRTPQNTGMEEVQLRNRPGRREVDYVEGRQYVEPPYGRTVGPRQTTVTNRVCDIYGQIHEPGQKQIPPGYGQIQSPAQNYGQIRQTGYVYGQLKQSPIPNSPVVVRQSYNQLNSPQNNFIRGTRLTASVNDMYKRYPVDNSRYQFEHPMEAPYRPLPPVPERKDSRSISVRKLVRGYAPISDTESGSEAGEVQRILQSGTKQQRNFNAIGKNFHEEIEIQEDCLH